MERSSAHLECRRQEEPKAASTCIARLVSPGVLLGV